MTKNKPSSTEDEKDQHRLSVETLRLSGHGNTSILPELYQLCLDSDLQLSKEQAIALTSLVHQKQQEARNQLLAELEAEGPEDRFLNDPLEYNPPDYEAMNTANDEWRALLKSKEEKV